MINRSKWIAASFLVVALLTSNPAFADALPAVVANQVLTIVGGGCGACGVYPGISLYVPVTHSASYYSFGFDEQGTVSASSMTVGDPTAASHLTVSGILGGTQANQTFDSKTTIQYEFEVAGPVGRSTVDILSSGVAFLVNPGIGTLGAESLFTIFEKGNPTSVFDAIACAGDTSKLANRTCSSTTSPPSSFNVNAPLLVQTNTPYIVNLFTEAYFSTSVSGHRIPDVEAYAFIDPTITLATSDPSYSLSFSPGVIPDASPVPEPSSILLLGTGALGLIGAIRRRSGRLALLSGKSNSRNAPLIAVILLACGSRAVFAQMPASPKIFASERTITAYSSSNTPDTEAASDRQASPVRGAGSRLAASTRPFSTVGVAVSVGTLGIGGQAAMPLSQRTNLRAEGNFFSYGGATYTNNGINYSGTLKLRSVEALLDWFPFGGSFRLSPGVQLYSGFNASGNLAVPSGQTFSLNHTSYRSSAAAPVTGTAMLTTNSAAPMFTFGWGNLVPRHGHISVPLELGFVYQGSPKVSIALAGKACDPSGLNCRDVTTDTGIQSNLAAQQKIVSDDVGQYFRFYPVISIGFGYKF